MQQLTLVEAGRLEWLDVPNPTIQSAEQAIVRPIAASRCDFDVAMLRGHPLFAPPFAFGHECVAEVVETGDSVSEVSIGDLVVVPFQISCGVCESCKMQITAGCTAHEPKGMYGMSTLGMYGADHDWGGAVSDYILVPYADPMLAKINNDVDPVHLASISDNLTDAWRCVGPYVQRFTDMSLLVVAGRSASIGLYSVLIAKALGVEHVDYVDADPGRREHAERLGANPIEPGNYERLGPYRVTVNASGEQEGLDLALKSAAIGGICTSTIVVGGGAASIPLQEMYIKSVTLKTGLINDAMEIPTVLKLVEEGVIRPELVTTHLDDWQNAPEAFHVEGSKLIVHRARITEPAGQS